MGGDKTNYRSKQIKIYIKKKKLPSLKGPPKKYAAFVKTKGSLTFFIYLSNSEIPLLINL